VIFSPLALSEGTVWLIVLGAPRVCCGCVVQKTKPAAAIVRPAGSKANSE